MVIDSSFCLFICFVIFVILSAKYLTTSIKKVVNTYQNKVESEINQSFSLKNKAKDLYKQHQKNLSDIDMQITNIKSEMHKDLEYSRTKLEDSVLSYQKYKDNYLLKRKTSFEASAKRECEEMLLKKTLFCLNKSFNEDIAMTNKNIDNDINKVISLIAK